MTEMTKNRKPKAVSHHFRSSWARSWTRFIMFMSSPQPQKMEFMIGSMIPLRDRQSSLDGLPIEFCERLLLITKRRDGVNAQSPKGG